jgi:hypothetical protein
MLPDSQGNTLDMQSMFGSGLVRSSGQDQVSGLGKVAVADRCGGGVGTHRKLQKDRGSGLQWFPLFVVDFVLFFYPTGQRFIVAFSIGSSDT